MTQWDEIHQILFVGVILAVCCLFSSAQTQEHEYEQWLDLEQESEEEGELLEYLEWRREHPLDVNRATVMELQSLPWLTPAMAQEMVHQRRKAGHFVSLTEMSERCGWDPELLRTVTPYLVCRFSQPTFYRFESRQRWSRRQQLSQGFLNDAYVGDPNKIYNRLRFNWNDRVRLGIMTEKDAGEKDFYDLTRAYLAFAVPPWHSEVIVGHFSLESGQGLIYAPLFQISRTFDPVLSESRAATGIRPNLSASENGGYQGLAWRYHSQKSEGVVFISRNRWDAIIENDTVRSILATGLHRTATEKERRGQLATEAYGLFFSRVFFDCWRNALAWRSEWFSPVIGKGGELKDHYDFSGHHQWAASWQCDFFKGPVNLFSEWGWNRRRAEAYKIGLRLQGHHHSFLLSWRHVSPAFDDPRSRWSTTDNANTTALVVAGRSRLSPQVQVIAYSEYSRNPWPRYQLPMPNFNRVESMVGMEWQPQKALELMMRLKYRRDYLAENYADTFGNVIKMMTAHGRWHLLGQWEYSQRKIVLRTRCEFKLHNQRLDSPQWPTMPSGRGLFFYQQIKFEPSSWLTVTTRYGMFDAPDYETRFYSYEQDLPGVWRNKMLYHRGLRWFVLCSFRPSRWLQASVKWEETVYDDQSFYGSGLDRVNTPKENILSFQLDWKWWVR